MFELLKESGNKTTNQVNWQAFGFYFGKDSRLDFMSQKAFHVLKRSVNWIIKLYGTIVLNKLESVTNIWEWYIYIYLELYMVYMSWDGWLKKLCSSEVLYNLDEIVFTPNSYLFIYFFWFPYSLKQFDQHTKTPVSGGAIFQKHHHFSTTTPYNASKGSKKKEA